MNTIKTALLLGALTGLLMLIGGYFGGQQGVIIAFIFAMVMNFGSYWFSDKIVLRMYKAQEVSEGQAPELYSIVKDLALKASIPMPRVYIIPGDAPNAFATGRNETHAVVAVTEGILRILNREELEGVIAHELTHIKNRDILIGSIAATIAGAIVMLAHMAQWAAIFGGVSRDNDEEGGGGIFGLIIMAILAPLAATLIQMAISRSREYLADDGGAQISRKPYGLASALEKMAGASQVIPMKVNPSTAHMFIVSPLTGRSLMNLFSTHPPIEERIARLRGMRPR
ncbi:MAG: protease HtpX [Syntrophaceae bacterium CG2_30_49_12]|nr:MAG: protease HtpX [Syntrophaceae bacterium CG2_30_49_12]PIP05592.1 MAG: protease HtpX [Syntrophobacterales bacterium CG23_combo_of_CG06-09_8_20_14_all_48_27]PJA48744.1 MAG: protease HtpX [Syntrophobacterales bacterium CG_4_9_14_3_um_filter_49_8]PJC75345.1 MAG: protease HtpX [Syntrophobacterales bacterium CG_4_8_14_3_um_filter_49_14]